MHTFYSKFIKRLLDILCSGLALLVLGIPMLIVAGLIWVDMGSPVLFRQNRIGKGEKMFCLLKFRSMKNAFDKDNVPLPDDQRITALGRFIRKTSIDELPSLINIFLGDMSVIGPRPLPWNYKPWFKESERVRHSVRGGLSGLAQVNGRATIQWEDKFAYDIDYINRISFITDVRIVIDTLLKAFIKQTDVGARDGSVPDFHCMRSGLEEKYLVIMESRGTLPDTLEQWQSMTESERRARYE